MLANDILIVDDEEDIRYLIRDILEENNFKVREAADGLRAIEELKNYQPRLLILDIWLQGSEIDGLGVLERAKAMYPNLPVIMISGHGNIDTAVTSIKLGAYDYIEKPFKEEKLVIITKRALEAYDLKVENDILKSDNIEETQIIGNSTITNQLKSQIEKIAQTSSRVMIFGEVGVGKKTAAKMIHNLSKRKNNNFISCDISTLHPHEIDKTLFGYEEISEQGEIKTKLGLIEKANHGILYLNEITHLNYNSQTKLLQFLQNSTFIRINGKDTLKTDVRIISSTSHDIENAIANNKFRKDLYYRLNVVPINIPHLRNRRDDIPELCKYFITNLAKMLGVPKRKISDEAMAVIQSYDWPGNIRQLKNIMEWILIVYSGSQESEITLKLLPEEILNNKNSNNIAELNAEIMTKPLREARELFEKQYLLSQLKRFGWNISRTSSFIQMERSALHRKLKALGVTFVVEEKV